MEGEGEATLILWLSAPIVGRSGKRASDSTLYPLGYISFASLACQGLSL